MRVFAVRECVGWRSGVGEGREKEEGANVSMRNTAHQCNPQTVTHKEASQRRRGGGQVTVPLERQRVSPSQPPQPCRLA